MRNDKPQNSIFTFAGIKEALGWTEEKKIQIGAPKNVVETGGIEPGQGGSDKFLEGIKVEVEKNKNPNKVNLDVLKKELEKHVLPVDKKPATKTQKTILENRNSKISKLLTELSSGDIKESWRFKTKLVELSIELESYSCFQKFENTVLLKRQEAQIKQQQEEQLNNQKFNEFLNRKEEKLVLDPLDQQTIRQNALDTINSKESTAQQKITALNNALALRNVGIPEELLFLEWFPKEKIEEIQNSHLKLNK